MKTIVFVDGFNLYHSINDVPKYHKYKWLDIKGLAGSFLTKSQEIVQVNYYTALATWHPEHGKVERHQKLITVYREMGIRVVEGEFKEKECECKLCGGHYISHEEKRTDVNIAIEMFDFAREGLYDIACLISGDSDLIPAVRKIRDRFPLKSFRLIIPIGRYADDLKRACGGDRQTSQITESHLRGNQLPDPFEGTRFYPGKLFSRPASWSASWRPTT